MEDVCLYDFVADYVKSGVDKDGKVVYRTLGKSVLPNHKLYNPNRENERESYFYSLLLLFVPFRNEGDLINDGENAENAFNRHMKENNALKTHSEKLCKMLKAHDTVQKINEARQAKAETVKENEPLEEDEGPQVVGEARSAMSDMFDLHQHDDSPSLEHLVSSLKLILTKQGYSNTCNSTWNTRHAMRVLNVHVCFKWCRRNWQIIFDKDHSGSGSSNMEK